QTPSSPQPYPQTGTGSRLSNRGLGGNTAGSGQLNSPLGGSRMGSDTSAGGGAQAPGPRNPVFERLRERDERRKQEAEQQKQGQQGQSAGGADAAKAAAESAGAAKNPAGERGASGGKPTVTGGKGPANAGGGGEKGGGGGTSFNKGAGGAVVMTGDGKFEPFLDRDVNYADVPDDGEPLTLEGPMPVGEFLSTISMATGWNIMVSPELQEVELKFWLNETRPREALKVLQFYKIFYEFDRDTRFLRVMSEEDYLKRSFGKRKPEEFKVRHVDPALAEQMLTSMLSSNGWLLSDQRTGTLYVWDAEDNLKVMREVFEKLDVPLEQREFTIRYADLPDIETVLSSMASQNGNLLSDARTGQIIVWDTPAVLEQMAMVVDRLDRPVETRTFELRHVNVEDIIESLESIITERGMIQSDPRYNTIMVSDLPQRLEKVAEVVAMLDRELESRTWTIRYADLDFIADEIEALVPESMGRITINEDVHQITVSAIPARLDEIDKLIQAWDVKRRQVFIEAYIVECTDEVERSFSINWSYYGNINGEPSVFHSGSGGASAKAPPGAGQALQFGTLPYAIPAFGALQLDSSGNITRPVLTDVNGKPITDRYAGNRLTAVLDYLDKQNKVTIIASPRVTVQDGEEAVFENATRVPYVSASTYYGGGGYYPTRSQTGDGTNNNTTPYYPYYSGYGLNNTNRVDFIDVGTI
ncbi:MAG TPA: secretin N-terminal domain-containing protein, partial [Candidatus Hydrogenedentes bacterium]|nr:secretin N-terminal domain-containing protein [Candidatus Hydrogenedentota bacterium]